MVGISVMKELKTYSENGGGNNLLLPRCSYFVDTFQNCCSVDTQMKPIRSPQYKIISEKHVSEKCEHSLKPNCKNVIHIYIYIYREREREREREGEDGAITGISRANFRKIPEQLFNEKI